MLGDNLITNGTMANFGVGYEGQELIDTDGDGGGEIRAFHHDHVRNSAEVISASR